MKPVLAMALIALSSVANAVQVFLVSHNQTSGTGTISTLITDGSHTSGIAGATTAVWDWDGTTLSATGLYSNVGSIGGQTTTATVLSDQIVNLTIDTVAGSASATGYACLEGTFLAVVGASGCGGYDLNAMGSESTTIWGPGTAISQTIGGDDVLTGPARSISDYDFADVSFIGSGLSTGDSLLIGNGVPVGNNDAVLGGGELMTFRLQTLAVEDAASTNPGVPVDIPVLANDVLDDGLGENIENLQVAAGAAGPQNGATIVIGTLPGPRAGLSIEYTPDPGFVGTDTFDYTVTDQSSAPTATVTVTVTDEVDANNDGTAGVPFATVLVNRTIGLDILANDTGLSGTPLTVISPVNTPPISPGTAMVVGSPGDASAIRIDFTAGPNPGADSFDYQVSDSNGSVDSATVFIEVLPLNTPIAVDDVATIAAAEPRSADIPDHYVNVLENDNDLGDTPLVVTITRDPAHGRISPIQNCNLQGSCKVWFTPDAGFIGADSFQYTVTDSTAETSGVANVAITVTERPVAVDDERTTSATDSVTINVLNNDSGLANTPLEVVITRTPVDGEVVVKANNSVVYTPPAGGGVGTDTFTYTVTDNNGKSSPAQVRINVSGEQNQDAVPGSSSAIGPVATGLLLMLSWMRRRPNLRGTAGRVN